MININGILTFLAVYFFWVIGGFISIKLRNTEFFFLATGFKVEYNDLLLNCYYYILFITVFYAGVKFPFIFKFNFNLNKWQINNRAEVYSFVSLIFVLYNLGNYGLSIASGDYFSRFQNDSNILVKTLPVIFMVLAFDDIIFCLKKFSFIKYKALIIILLTSLLSVLTGSRLHVFYFSLCTLIFLFYYLDIFSQKNIFEKFFIAIVFVFIYYFFGQLINIVRWFGLGGVDINEMIIAALGDSFPEVRSHVYGANIISDAIVDRPGIFGWLRNLSAYFIPGFLYNIIGMDRSFEFNYLWKNFFEQIFWNGEESLYGIRVGLVGEVSMVMGWVGLIFFGFFYGIIIKSERILPAIFMCGTIIYGASSIYLLMYSIIFSFFANFVLKNILKN